MTLLIWSGVLLYVCLLLLSTGTWLSIASFKPKPPLRNGEGILFNERILVTVIIPVRNEAGNIRILLEDLNRQTLNFATFEVIVVDDHSTDDTARLVSEFVPKAHYTLKVISLADPMPWSPKKQAITQAMAEARGELIVTTDGDCRVLAGWLETLYQFYQAKDACLISGPVTFYQESSWFEQMQSVEFASLIGAGAVSLTLGLPTMCNGANLAYPQWVFKEVGGYGGVDRIASGDDEFLLHKIARKYPKQVFFLKSPGAIVRTFAQKSLRNFYQQRRRWGSKWKYYQDNRVKILAFFIFTLNFGLLLATIGVIAGLYPFKVFIYQYLLKSGVEGIFLGWVLCDLKKCNRVWWIPGVQVLYPLYVSITGLAAQGGTYQWKGRSMR
ncbi:MAG: glycosyltransferase [Bacteroidia bacterium]|nr:glycosyltransferase [Bacteroidia bacterium]